MNKQNLIRLAVILYSLSLISSCTKDTGEDSEKHSPYISKVFDYKPAVGQFSNLPIFEPTDTKTEILAKIEYLLVGKESRHLISLGGFGGYIIFGFDHMIENKKRLRDIRITGNAFHSTSMGQMAGSAEPGIIMVAYDANKNLMPDDNEWYEIAGSEYYKSTTIKNYSITYYRPEIEDKNPLGKYIRWTDNKGEEGWIAKNEINTKSYFPYWLKEDKITFEGTRLPDNAVMLGGEENPLWVLNPYGHGYADNTMNDNLDSAIDISWAVDSEGNRVDLPGIHFVKIYTGINQQAGILGEVSTEFSCAYDMHLLNEVVATNIDYE